jgi:hypothetical protein
MKKAPFVIGLTAAAIAFSCASCISLLNEATGTPTGPAPVNIVNQSSQAITQVLYRAFGAGIWDTATVAAIPAGDSVTFHLPGSSTYDIRVKTANGDSASVYDQNYWQSSTTRLVFTDTDFGPKPQFTVKNSSSNSITYTYYRTAGGSTWLTASTNTIVAGDSAIMQIPAAGTYDIMVSEARGDSRVRSNIPVSGTVRPTLTFIDTDFP